MLDTSAKEIWEKEVKPVVTDMHWNFKGDEILVRELDSLLNHIDTDIAAGRSFVFRIENLTKIIGQKQYCERFRDPADARTVNRLLELLNTLVKVARYDDRLAEKAGTLKPPVRDRLPNANPEDLPKLYGRPDGVPERRFN